MRFSLKQDDGAPSQLNSVNAAETKHGHPDGCTLKGRVAGAAALVFALYLLSVTVMCPYYWWRDVKVHDSYLRAILGSPVVGLFKASHWPYYAFFSSPKVSNSHGESVSAFFACYEYLKDIQTLVLSISKSKTQKEDAAHVQTLLSSALARLRECDSARLNEVHAGWSDITDRTLRPALQKMDACFRHGRDDAELARVDALLAEFDTWLRDNWNIIGAKVGE